MLVEYNLNAGQFFCLKSPIIPQFHRAIGPIQDEDGFALARPDVNMRGAMVIRVNPNTIAINIQNGRHHIRNHKPNSLGFGFQVRHRFASSFWICPPLCGHGGFRSRFVIT
jgi:hypothetical protein